MTIPPSMILNFILYHVPLSKPSMVWLPDTVGWGISISV